MMMMMARYMTQEHEHALTVFVFLYWGRSYNNENLKNSGHLSRASQIFNDGLRSLRDVGISSESRLVSLGVLRKYLGRFSGRLLRVSLFLIWLVFH